MRIKNALVHKNQDDKAKRFKAQRYYLTKGLINNFNVIINGKSFYEQPINSDLKRYEELIKLKTGQRLYQRMFVRLWIHQKLL